MAWGNQSYLLVDTNERGGIIKALIERRENNKKKNRDDEEEKHHRLRKNYNDSVDGNHPRNHLHEDEEKNDHDQDNVNVIQIY